MPLRFCPYYCRVAWTHDTDKRQVLLTRIGCGSWSCEFCSALMRRKWLRHLRAKMPEIGAVWWLLTFTAPQDSYTQADSIKRLRRGIDVFFKRTRRTWGDIQYVRVYEAHKQRTTVHAHIVVWGLSPFVSVDKSKNGLQNFIPLDIRKGRKGTWSIRTFVKKAALACGMGYIADAKKVDGARAIFYVTKYLAKDQQQLNIRNLRHVQTTRKIGSPKSEKQSGWIVGYRINKAQIYGDEVVWDAQRNSVVPQAYWRFGNIYPPIKETEELKSS